MGFFSKLFNRKGKNENVQRRSEDANVVNVKSEDDGMKWAIEKANLTLHYFENCLVSPKPTQQYFSIKVKIDDGRNIEHLWLTEPSFDEEGNLFGVVGNQPLDVKSVTLGQKIGIDRNLISDWMIIENGRLIGGYTIRAIRDHLSGNDLVNFDRGLGGMMVDEGEDYFLPSNKTPEGAIIAIEEAYDQDDIEKAMACKDFKIEARFMLNKIGNGIQDEAVENKTAEVLKLSFIKHMQENGMPKFNGIKRAFPKREKISDQEMIITEVCYYPDGGKSKEKLRTYLTEDGWKVIGPVQ